MFTSIAVSNNSAKVWISYSEYIIRNSDRLALPFCTYAGDITQRFE